VSEVEEVVGDAFLVDNDAPDVSGEQRVLLAPVNSSLERWLDVNFPDSFDEEFLFGNNKSSLFYVLILV
jgi:hypothetical protein